MSEIEGSTNACEPGQGRVFFMTNALANRG